MSMGSVGDMYIAFRTLIGIYLWYVSLVFGIVLLMFFPIFTKKSLNNSDISSLSETNLLLNLKWSG